MQESLRLRRGRGRGLNRGDTGDDISYSSQPRVPAIPPFPFHHHQIFEVGDALKGTHRPLSRGRGLSNPGGRGLCNPLPPGQCDSVPKGFTGLRGPAPPVLRGPAAQGLRGPAAQGLRGPAAQGLRGPAAQGLRGPAPRGLCNPASMGIGLNVGGPALRFPVPNEEEARKHSQSNFFPYLPKPRPNSLTQQEWDVLNRNGRPGHKSVCVVICCCTFGEGDSVERTFSFCCDGKSASEHTEKKAIEQLLMLENGSGRELRKVILISSRSPCIPCAEDMITFFKSRGFSMNLYFTALQKEINPERSGIALLASVGIPMRIVDKHIWSYLTSLLAICDGKPRTAFSDGSKVNVIYQKAWDVVWSQQLGAVLYQDHPNVLSGENLFAKFNDVRRVMIAQAQKNT